MIIITGGQEKSMAGVDSFPRYMSSFYSCSYPFSDSYHLHVQQEITFMIVSCPNPSQCGIYSVAHSVSVSLYRIA